MRKPCVCSDVGSDGDNTTQDHVIDNKVPIWCQDFLNCKQQVGTAFGCVQVSPIRVFAG